jgi:hypothetical protein
MDAIARFGEYAQAFEKAYESDDWSILEPYFTADAVYEIIGDPPLSGRKEGRDAVFDHLKTSVDGFDKRFDTRELELLKGPELRDGAVWLRWQVRYTRAGLPELKFVGEETARFEGDRIDRLVDRYGDGVAASVASYFSTHGAKLKPVGG